MKYKIFLSLLVVSVLACSVADAEDELPKVLKNLPKGWQSGTPFDMDLFDLDGLTKRQVKQLLGRAPDKLFQGDRDAWRYFGVFKDEITEKTFDCLKVEFKYHKVFVAYFDHREKK